MRTYLVTGGAGFIGSHIVEQLLLIGQKVRVIDNFSTGSKDFLSKYKNDIELIHGNILNLSDCLRATKGVEFVMHQAALRSVPKSVLNPFAAHANGATGTLNMLEAAKRSGVRRFVYASSSSVYGIAESFPMKETDRVKPLSPYGVSKLAGELYAYSYFINYGLETVSLRYFNVFGSRQSVESSYALAVPAFIDSFINKKRPIIYGNGKQSRDFTYIDNVVKANMLACHAPKAKGHVFNIASGEDHTVLELYKLISKVMCDSKLQPIFKGRRPSDPDRTYADITKAKKLLGWTPEVDFEEGIKRTVKWFCQNK